MTRESIITMRLKKRDEQERLPERGKIALMEFCILFFLSYFIKDFKNLDHFLILY